MKPEPVALLYQHGETGRTTFRDPGENLIEWEAENKGWQFVAPLYAIPEGYVVVPVEPTEAMIKAARLAYMSGDGAYSETYKAMIAAGE